MDCLVGSVKSLNDAVLSPSGIQRHTAQEVDYLRSTLSNFPILCVLSKTKTLARFLHSLSLDFSFSLASIFLGIEGGKCRG